MVNASGNQVEGPYTYDSYGNCFTAGAACSTSGTPYRFVGMRLDPETGLYYDRARYYSASIGRFLQTDPVGYDADLDLYTYGNNDPVGKADPTGADYRCVTTTESGIPIWVMCYDTKTGQPAGIAQSIWMKAHGSTASPGTNGTNPGVSPAAKPTAPDAKPDAKPDEPPHIEVDETGKVHGRPLPKPEDVRDEDVPDAIDALEESIKTRTEEQNRSPRGNRNSPDPEKRAEWQRFQNHQRALEEEKDLLRRLRKRMQPWQ